LICFISLYCFFFTIFLSLSLVLHHHIIIMTTPPLPPAYLQLPCSAHVSSSASQQPSLDSIRLAHILTAEFADDLGALQQNASADTRFAMLADALQLGLLTYSASDAEWLAQQQ
jgi:hypothetical protein